VIEDGRLVVQQSRAIRLSSRLDAEWAQRCEPQPALLDQLMEHEHSFPSFHAILARDNKIDTYSYLDEVMLETEVRFDHAQAIAADFLNDGGFNQAAFITAWQEN